MSGPDPCLLDSGDPRRDLLKRIIHAARSMRTYVDHRAAAHGTTQTQWRALKSLVIQDGRNQVELADILEIQPISLVRLLDRMAAQDLIARRADPTDRRAKLVFITEAGRRLLREIEPLAHEISAEITVGLDETEIAVLNAMLDRLNCNARQALTRRQMADARRGTAEISDVE